MNFFGRKDAKEEQKEKYPYFYWTYQTLAEELHVHKKTVWRHFERKIGFDQVEKFISGLPVRPHRQAGKIPHICTGPVCVLAQAGVCGQCRKSLGSSSVLV